MTNIAMEAMALIEIDGLPINSMVIFHGYVTKNQMVYQSKQKPPKFQDSSVCCLLGDRIQRADDWT